MATIHPAGAVLVASGLLVGCSGGGSSPMPAAGLGSQPIQTRAQTIPQRVRGGRVLYVGNIDGQPGLGEILVYGGGMKSPQLLRTITNGAGRPFGMWVDEKNILYVANYPNKLPGSITEFKPGASSPFFQIGDFKGYPQSVAVDSHQDVFVNESVQDEGYVQVYPPHNSTPEATIDTGIGGYAFEPGGMGFDPQGNLIVAEQAKLKLQIIKIAPGSWTVSPMNLDLTNIDGPGLGVDKAGNVYVASSAGSTVSVFPPGATEPSRTISNVPAYGYMSVTPQGAVYAASGEYTVTEVAPGSNAPIYTLSCECSAQGAAVSR